MVTFISYRIGDKPVPQTTGPRMVVMDEQSTQIRFGPNLNQSQITGTMDWSDAAPRLTGASVCPDSLELTDHEQIKPFFFSISIFSHTR